MGKKELNLGAGNKLIYVIDLDEPDSVFEKAKLLKIDEMVDFIWEVQHKVVFDAKEMTGKQVSDLLIKLLEEKGLNSDELTY